MQTMCAGSYPSIEEQALRLHDEPGMPEWSLATYIKQIEAINMALTMVMVEHYRRSLKRGPF